MRLKVWLLLACAPRLLQAALLAQTGAGCLGDGGADRLRGPLTASLKNSVDLPFFLTHSAQVHAEADGLSHLNLDPGAAAEAFLDDQLIGPVQNVHGLRWRSSLAPSLAPGLHHFVLRNAAVEDAEDFCWRHLGVYSDGDPAPSQKTKPKPLVHEGDCDLLLRRDWPAALKGGLVLSVLQGAVAKSGSLVLLGSGEAWDCQLRIPSHLGKPQALSVAFETQPDAGGRWVFLLDPHPPAAVDALGYKPDHWERFHATLCNGVLTIQFAQVPAMKIPWKDASLRLEIAAREVEIDLRPARSEGR